MVKVLKQHRNSALPYVVYMACMALSTALSMLVSFSSSKVEPLLSPNQARQHVFWDCVSCQYVPTPMSSRQIRLHMSHFANKVTWCLGGKILRCAAAAAAGGCVDAALQGHSEQKEGSYSVLNMQTQSYAQRAHVVVLPCILDTLSIPFPYFTCALPPLGCTPPLFLLNLIPKVKGPTCKNFCINYSKMYWNYQQNVMEKQFWHNFKVNYVLCCRDTMLTS